MTSSASRPRSHSLLLSINEELSELLARAIPAVVGLDDVGSSGSGFAVDEEGHLVTNYHVVENMVPPIIVTFAGGEHSPGELIGVDAVTDLAVVRPREPPPSYLSLREQPPRIGELCLAVGNPLGEYPESASIGIVSGLARSLEAPIGGRHIEHVIQTDAAINSGNSGGPLLDVLGYVIGVNDAMDTRAVGISFAIPAETVRYVATEIIQHGGVERAALGVHVATKAVTLGGKRMTRVVVSNAGRPASGDLRPGDIIVALDGHPIRDRGDLFRLLTRHRIGRQTTLEVHRDGLMQEVQVTPIKWQAQ